MMNWKFSYLALLMLFVSASYAQSVPVGPIMRGNATYYVVNGSNPNLNSGDRVCAAVHLQCVGYTSFNTTICQQQHPSASVRSTWNGTNSGYYCNGAPQSGQCSSATNTCFVCSACNQISCQDQIGDQYREMYVQCATNATAALAHVKKPQVTTITYTYTTTSSGSGFSFFGSISSFFHTITSWFSNIFTHQSSSPFTTGTTSHNTTTLIGPYPGFWGCTFFQTPWPGVNQKKVSCNVYKAADSFCAVTLQSQYATAAYCNETSGLVVCINPCNKGGQVMPAGCPYDAARPNGAQAAPTNWC